VGREQGDVGAALAQRRNAQVDDVETVVEVLTEASLPHQRSQVAVGGRQDTGANGNAMGRPDRTDLLLLQGAQQAGLQVERQLADLVKENGTLPG